MAALLPAELAWYATGRFYKSKDGTVADYGYFLHLPFAGVPLFDRDQPSETAAHFTFAATPFRAGLITNGTLSLGLDPVGEFSLYLQRQPAGTFADPASFARGERIATFRRASVTVGTTVGASVTLSGMATTVPLLGTNVFSAWLVESSAFEFAGGRHDLAEHIGTGVTQFGISATTPITPVPAGYDLVLPFTGSAVALG